MSRAALAVGMAVACAARALALDSELIMSVVVSRHGVRAPYPPRFSTADDYTVWTDREWPGAAEFGQTQEAFENQYLTPQGEELMVIMGAYMRERYTSLGLDVPCDSMLVYADGASHRDEQTAHNWINGFGCPDVEVVAANATNFSVMEPVVSDHNPGMCSPANEEQTSGLYGGNLDALLEEFAPAFALADPVIDVSPDALVCNYTGAVLEEGEACTMEKLPYEWTGQYWNGMFYAPVSYLSAFAESWLLQYLSGVEEVAFNMLSLQDISQIYDAHIKTLWFGTSWWNSITYGSTELGYVLLSLWSKAYDAPLLYFQPTDPNLIIIFSHDINVLYLQRLIQANWLVEGFYQNVASTGGCVEFQLHRDTSGDFFVKVSYIVATPDQQRYKANLTVADPPSVSEIVMPVCGELYCALDSFRELVFGVANADCMSGSEPIMDSYLFLQKTTSSDEGEDGADAGGGGDDDDDSGVSSLVVVLATLVGVLGVVVVGVVGYLVVLRARHNADSNVAYFGLNP